MDSHAHQKSRLNWKIIVTCLAVIVLLLAGGAIGLKVRRKSMIQSAYDRAQRAVAEKRWPIAYREFKYYLSKNKLDLEARLQFARACLYMDPPLLSDAANAYRFVLQKRPGDRDVSRRLATLYYRGRDFDDAAYICRQRLEKDPTDDDATMLLGEALVSQGSFAEADALLRALIERNPQYPDAYVLLSSIAVQRDPREGTALAGQWLDRAVEANPDSAKALAYRARYRRTVLRDYDGAREDLLRAAANPPTDPWAMLLMVEQWTELGDLKRAERSLQQVRSLNRDDLIEREMYLVTFDLARFVTEARLVMELDAPDRAVQLADQAKSEFDDAELYAVLPTITELYLKAKRIDLASEMIAEFSGDRMVAQIAKAGAQRNLAVCAAMIESAQNRWHQTINTLEPLAESGMLQDQRTWSLLGTAYDETGQTNRAVIAWEKAFALGSVSTETAERLVRACLSRDLIKGYRIASSALHRSANSFETQLLQTEVLVSAAVLGWVAPQLVETMKADLESWAVQHPANGRIRILQAALAASENQTERVVSLLNKVLSDCDRKREALNSLVTYHISRGNLDDAIKACRNAIGLVGNLADPHVFLARIIAGSGRFEEARSVLVDAAVSLDGMERFNVQTALADLLIQYGRRQEAIKLLLQLAREHPDDVHIRAELLKIPQVQNDRQLAPALLSELREIEGERGLKWRFAEALMHLASTDWDTHVEQIETLLKVCIRFDSTWPEPVIALASLYERTDRFEDAERVYRQHFDQHPNHLDIAGKLLELLERERKFAEADAILQRVPRELADMSGHRVNIAIGRGKYDEAIAELQQRRQTDPQDAISRLILAELLYQVHRDAAAAFALLDEAQQLKPDLRSVVSAKLELLRSEDRLEEATRIANQQVESYGDFAAYLMRASHYAACGRSEDAERDYKKLITFDQQRSAGYLALGNFYFNANRLDEAIATWRDGLTVLPDDVGITHRLVEALLAHSDQAVREEGRRLLEEGLESFPNDMVLLHLRATDLLGRRTVKAFRDAVAILEKIVSTDPRNVKAYLQLVQLAVESGRRDDALSLVNQALGANPGSDALLLARAGLEREQGHLRLARSLAASVLAANPDDLAAKLMLAEIAVAQGNYEEADSMTAAVLRIEPANESANLLRARILRDRSELAQAVASLTAFCDTPAGGSSGRAYAALARMLTELGKLAPAARAMEKAESLSGDSSGVFQARLEWLAASNRFDDIVTAIDQRAKSGLLPSALITFAGQLMLRSQRDDLLPMAMELFDRVINLRGHPLDIRDAQIAKAQAAFRLNDIEKSIECYRIALKLDPYNNRALNNLSWILSEKSDRPNEALEFANLAVARYPDDANLLDTRGIILHRLNRHEQAAADFNHCVELSQDDPALKSRALIHLAKVLIDMGDSEDAIKFLEQSLEIDRKTPVLEDVLRKEAQDLLSRIG